MKIYPKIFIIIATNEHSKFFLLFLPVFIFIKLAIWNREEKTVSCILFRSLIIDASFWFTCGGHACVISGIQTTFTFEINWRCITSASIIIVYVFKGHFTAIVTIVIDKWMRRWTSFKGYFTLKFYFGVQKLFLYFCQRNSLFFSPKKLNVFFVHKTFYIFLIKVTRTAPS